MESIQKLADESFRNKVRQARATSPEERLLAVPRLFEQACKAIKGRIQEQFPEASDEEVRHILSKVLPLYRRHERR